MANLKPDVSTRSRDSLTYIVGPDNQVIRHKPWLGDAFSFLYDRLMAGSVFPKKLSANMENHYEGLKEALEAWHGKRVLELAAGSGSATCFLPSDNLYVGTDISPGLLKRAASRFEAAGFKEPEFYVVDAGDLPFGDLSFDLCLCILSLNFFDDVRMALGEVWRVLTEDGVFLCSVPVPERMKANAGIHGTLYSEEQLAGICRDSGFRFDPLPMTNGALLYFKARKEGSARV